MGEMGLVLHYSHMLVLFYAIHELASFTIASHFKNEEEKGCKSTRVLSFRTQASIYGTYSRCYESNLKHLSDRFDLGGKWCCSTYPENRGSIVSIFGNKRTDQGGLLD